MEKGNTNIKIHVQVHFAVASQFYVNVNVELFFTLNSIWRYLVVERYRRVTVDPLIYPTIRTRVYY